MTDAHEFYADKELGEPHLTLAQDLRDFFITQKTTFSTAKLPQLFFHLYHDFSQFSWFELCDVCLNMQFDACCQSNAFPDFDEGRFRYADVLVASDLWDRPCLTGTV